tara:strand:+ start:115 stop:396 length:282 start_codon:yes stop_codon:yes gene_type:complete
MATTTSVCMLSHVANLLGEDLDLLEAIVSNDDNLTCGNIVSVQVDQETYQTALTDDGIGELRDMLRAARRLCCTNRLTAKLPLFPDTLIPRPL